MIVRSLKTLCIQTLLKDRRYPTPTVAKYHGHWYTYHEVCRKGQSRAISVAGDPNIVEDVRAAAQCCADFYRAFRYDRSASVALTAKVVNTHGRSMSLNVCAMGKLLDTFGFVAGINRATRRRLSEIPGDFIRVVVPSVHIHADGTETRHKRTLRIRTRCALRPKAALIATHAISRKAIRQVRRQLGGWLSKDVHGYPEDAATLWTSDEFVEEEKNFVYQVMTFESPAARWDRVNRFIDHRLVQVLTMCAATVHREALHAHSQVDTFRMDVAWYGQPMCDASLRLQAACKKIMSYYACNCLDY
jgi:hypothetical protein